MYEFAKVRSRETEQEKERGRGRRKRKRGRTREKKRKTKKNAHEKTRSRSFSQNALSFFSPLSLEKVWGCSRDASNEIVHAFFDSRHFSDGIEPIPGAAEALRTAREFGASLAVVTSRQHVIRQPTLDWLDAHFGLPLFDAGVHFGNHWALEGRSTSKSELCGAIGASVLVDDNPGYAAECAEAGMRVLLYDWQGAYPWAKPPAAIGEHPNVEVVKDWGEVEAALRGIAAEVAAAAGSGGTAATSSRSA